MENSRALSLVIPVLALLMTVAGASLVPAMSAAPGGGGDVVTILTPEDGGTVSGEVRFTVEVRGCFCNGTTTLEVDGDIVSEGERTGTSEHDGDVFEVFTHVWDSSGVAEGVHAAVVWGKHHEHFDQVTLRVENGDGAPAAGGAAGQAAGAGGDDDGDDGVDGGDGCIGTPGEDGGDGGVADDPGDGAVADDEAGAVGGDDAGDDDDTGDDDEGEDGGEGTKSDEGGDGNAPGGAEVVVDKVDGEDLPEEADDSDGEDPEPLPGDGSEAGPGETIGVDDRSGDGEGESAADSADGDAVDDGFAGGSMLALTLLCALGAFIAALVALFRTRA